MAQFLTPWALGFVRHSQSRSESLCNLFTKSYRKPDFKVDSQRKNSFTVLIDLFFFALTLSGKERLHLFEERLSLRHYILLIQFSQLPQQLYLL